jgi:hypothetical protein
MVVFRTPHSLALVGNTSKPKLVSGADTYDEKAMSGQSALGPPVNSALRLLTRSPRAIQIAPCQTIWSTISNNLTTAWLAACADSPWAGVRPVVYLFDRAAWWAAWLASAQRRAPVPANGGYGFST